MLYDILKLPDRVPEFTEIETILPYFEQWSNIEDNVVYGRIFQTPQVVKYKTIELCGNTSIERIFTTDEEIDFKKSWWKSGMNIIPLSFKIFDHSRFSSNTYRYVEGIERLLTRGNWDGRAKPIHLEELDVARRVLRSQKQIHTVRELGKVRRNVRHPIHKLFSGNDLLNVGELQMLREYDWNGIMEDDLHGQYVHIFPSMWMPNLNFNDALTQICSKEDPVLSDIAKIRTRSFGVTASNMMMSGYEEPFTCDGNTLAYYEEQDDARWSFHVLMQWLEQSPYTDMSADITFRGHSVLKKKIELYSRYFGITNYQKLDNSYDNTIQRLIQHLGCWISELFPALGEYSVSLRKNWLEEVFIELKIGGKVSHYYIDLVMYGLGNLSLLEFE